MAGGRKSGFLEKIGLPAIGAAFIAGAAMAATGDIAAPAFGGPAQALSSSDADRRAALLFAQSDLDGSGDLSVEEFSALSVVSAELARLSGFVALDVGGETSRVIDIADVAPASVSLTERTRIEAVASHEFHDAAGPDGVLDEDDFLALERERFIAADLNGDGALKRQELSVYGLRVARAPVSAS